MDKLPLFDGLHQIYIMADMYCKVLMMRGMNAKAAEATVLNEIKKYDSDLKMGNYKKIETALEVKFA
jgi:hypothetical protein